MYIECTLNQYDRYHFHRTDQSTPDLLRFYFIVLLSSITGSQGLNWYLLYALAVIVRKCPLKVLFVVFVCAYVQGEPIFLSHLD